MIFICRVYNTLIHLFQMFNFNSMFNPSRNQTPSLSDLLSSPNNSLMRLLDDDTFISELRSTSPPPQLKQYMNYQRLQQLVLLVTQIGDPSDKKRSFKFPLTAADILSSQSTFILDKLLPDEGVIEQEERVVTMTEREVQQEVEDDEDNLDDLELSSEEASKQQKKEKNKEREEEGKEKEEKGKGDGLVQQEKKEEVEVESKQEVEGKSEAEEIQKAVENKTEVEGKVQLTPSQQESKVSGEEPTSELKKQPSSEQQFGQFIQAAPKPKRTIKLKQVIETVSINKKQYPPLVTNILLYFTTPINYTLTSYSCKVLTSLLNKRTPKFFSKFFQQEQTPISILKHIESRSTVEFLTRVFTIQTDNNLQKRSSLFKSVLELLGKPNEVEVMSNISATLCQTFQKISTNLKSINPCKPLEIYFNSIPNFLQITINNIISEDQNVSVYSAPFIYHLLNSLPTALDDENIDNILARFIDGVINKLTLTIQEKRSRIGVGRVKMIEVLNFILKRNQTKQFLSKKDSFFPLLFSITKAFPLNNILHNQIFKIINSSLTSDNLLLTDNILANTKILIWLEEQAQQQKKRLQISRPFAAKGYAGHLVNLCKQLQQLSKTNTFILQLIQNQRFQDVVKVLVQKQIISHQKTLGGYAMRKQLKFPILFSREDILKEHSTFLLNARPAVFEVDLDDPLQNPALFDQLQRQLDGIQIHSSTASVEVVEEQKHKAELIEQNQHHKSAFWRVHLDYDVNQLLNDLL